MIQRIQTVFLLLSIVALGLFLWLPLLQMEQGSYTHAFKGWEVYARHTFESGPYLIFLNAILTGTAAGLTLINIFLYKKRSFQMLLCWFSILLIVTAQAFVYYEYQTMVYVGDVVLRKWNLFSFVAIGFEILAFAYIRKDEEKIKSLNRLR